MARTMTSDSVRIVSIGGIGEIGKNCTVIEYGDDAIVLDCGITFPDADMFGVDLVLGAVDGPGADGVLARPVGVECKVARGPALLRQREPVQRDADVDALGRPP